MIFLLLTFRIAINFCVRKELAFYLVLFEVYVRRCHYESIKQTNDDSEHRKSERLSNIEGLTIDKRLEF